MGRARAGRGRQVKVEEGCKTWTASLTSTTWRACGPRCHLQRARRQRQNRGRGDAEGNPPTPSITPGKAGFGGINGSSSSSSSDDSRTSSDSSSDNDSGGFPALARWPARDLEVFGELPALRSRRTMIQSRGFTMSTSYADALLVYAIRAAEAKTTIEEKVAEIERTHDSLLEQHLEKEREWLEELERCGALLDWRYCLTLLEPKALRSPLCEG